ncbi:MAG: hypothetical protein ACI4BD_07805 [Paludibacteraceae bacterium]
MELKEMESKAYSGNQRLLGTQASRLRGPRKQRAVGCSLRAFWNKTKSFAMIVHSATKKETESKEIKQKKME